MDETLSLKKIVRDSEADGQVFDGMPPAPDLDSVPEPGADDQSEQTGQSSGEETGRVENGDEEREPKSPQGPGQPRPDQTDPAAENDNDDTHDTTGPDGAEGFPAGIRGKGGDDPNDGRNAGAVNDANDECDRSDTGAGRAEPCPAPVGPGDGGGRRQGYLPRRAIELLPNLLAGPASRLGDRRERDVFLTAALPVWASGLPNVRIQYGQNVSPNLYSAVIAPPASGKSAVSYARRYARPLGEELRAGGPVGGASPDEIPEGEMHGSDDSGGGGAADEDSTGEDSTGQDAAGENSSSGDNSGDAPESGSSPPNGEDKREVVPGSEAGRPLVASGQGAGSSPHDGQFFLAGDTSAAALKERLAESPHGVILETEFRTLSQALGSSWGKFEDVLLKGFQNEAIQVNRSSRGQVTISHPAPSIAIAGTPATFEGVISGTGDGLFSRFLFYRFDREFEWSSPFGESTTGIGERLREAAEDFRAGYHQLRAREAPLQVTVPGRLKRAHERVYGALTRKWKQAGVPRSLRASLTRSGLQAAKIATVLRMIRLIESGRELTGLESVALRPEDMEAALRLALAYLLHGVRVERRFRSAGDPRERLTEQQQSYLEALPERPFSTGEAKALAPTFDVSKRNAQRWLKNWREAGLLTKPKRGTWAKLSPELGGIRGAQGILSVMNDIPDLTGGCRAADA